MTKLIIVESPAKCKKMQSYAGNGYICKASFGHIRDLDKGLGAIDIHNQFNPTYKNIPSKSKVIRELKKIAKNCSEVIIASDLDREGEAIGYHIAKVLNLDIATTKRIIFNQITKNAVLKALQNPTRLNMNLFYSQQARRILDRLVGFELSPLLWKFVKLNLSAGRCQSPAVRLVYDREQEINNFQSQLYFEINFTGQVIKHNYPLEGKIIKKYTELNKITKLLKDCKKAIFTIHSIDQKICKNKPSPPFTTSSLQQEASSKLGISPKMCMIIAQKLYESGKITYMRTDSVELSTEALNLIKTHIIQKFGKEHYEFRKYKTKTKASQEAHEAIRPVYPSLSTITDGFNNREQKLYNLIYKRTIASQMKCSKKKVYTIILKMNNRDDLIQCVIEKIIYLGYLKIYNGVLSEKDPVLEQLTIGDQVQYDTITATQKYSKSKGRYTEASLIKALEKKGIGRPSTFSNIISTIQSRDYVIKDTRTGKKTDIIIVTLHNNKIKETKKEITLGTEKNKLFLTDTGKLVIEFLIKHFQHLMNYNFTSNIETQLDTIANGTTQWFSTVQNVYDTFHPKVIELKQLKQDKTNNHRKIGHINNEPIIAFVGHYGPVIQIGNHDNKKKNKYYKIPKHLQIETITIEDVEQLAKYPIDLGQYQTHPILLKKGPYGFYINYQSQNISLKDINEDNIEQFSKNNAIKLIQQNSKKKIKEFGKNIEILNGPYGHYIKYKKKHNISIPKKYSIETLTKEDCTMLIKRKLKLKNL